MVTGARQRTSWSLPYFAAAFFHPTFTTDTMDVEAAARLPQPTVARDTMPARNLVSPEQSSCSAAQRTLAQARRRSLLNRRTIMDLEDVDIPVA